jgi:hypothetical protein
MRELAGRQTRSGLITERNGSRTFGPKRGSRPAPALTMVAMEMRVATDPNNEEWRAIKDWPAYEVSSHGNVRRVLAGKGTRTGLLKLQVSKRGYPVATLRMMPRYTKTVVHRLVCEAFHGPPPEGQNEVAHGDGVRTNNRAGNLRWASRRENAADTLEHGTNYIPPPKSPALCSAIRRARAAGLSYSQLAARFPVSQGTAWKIVMRKGAYS